MTGRERFMTALSGGKPDRVPLFLRDLTLGLDLCEYTTPEVSAVYDSEKAARAVIASQQRFCQDAVVGCIHDLALDVEPLGGKASFPEDGVPRVAEHPLADDAAVASAHPFDPHTQGRWPQVIDTYRRVRESVGEHAAVAANIEGPVTRAGVLRGLEQFAMDMALNEELAERIVELSVEIAVRHVRCLSEVADFIFIAAASDGPAVISPDHYLKYTIPGLLRIVEASEAVGLPVVFHPHGAFTQPRFHELVNAAIACGIRGFQFCEDCDLGFAKSRWGREICILGGPDVPTVLNPGPPERVREETKACLDAAMGDGGFVIMASCSLHRGAPLGHLDAMAQAAGDYGVYT